MNLRCVLKAVSNARATDNPPSLRASVKVPLPPPPRACPRCGNRKIWILKDGRRRCARCRYDWRPGRWPLRLTAAKWQAIVRWFVRGAPSAAIALETRLDRKRVLRALTVIRTAIAREGPRPGTARRSIERRARARPAPLVIGLRSFDGRGVWAEVVPEPDAVVLRSVTQRRPVALDRSGLSRYAAVVYRGRFYRLRPRGAAPFGPIESFWGYLRQRLRSKGGIRPARLHLYLSEYSWRYNSRRLDPEQQRQELLRLLRQQPAGGGNVTLAARPGGTGRAE